jgi:glycosyltransferase involved in cell wall biosynthesis
MTSLRIAMVMSVPMPPREGIGFHVWHLARELQARGHRVTVITRGGLAGYRRQVADGLVVWQAPFWPLYPLHVHWHGCWVDRLLQRLAGELDVVHLHTPLVRRPRTPLPVVVTVHTPMRADVAAGSGDGPVALLSRCQLPVSVRLETGLLREAAVVTAVAGRVAVELAPYGVDPAAVRVVGNGVDTGFFSPDGARDGGTAVLTVGRLAPRKGMVDLVESAAQVVTRRPDACYQIAGDGPLAGALRRQIRAWGLTDHVTLLGHVGDRVRLRALYRRAAVCVHPARYEGMPTAVLEAMACGRPVVATAAGGAAEALRDGESGLLVRPGAPEALAKSTLALLENPALGRRLGAAARRTVTERYSWDLVTGRYLDVYAEVLG